MPLWGSLTNNMPLWGSLTNNMPLWVTFSKIVNTPLRGIKYGWWSIMHTHDYEGLPPGLIAQDEILIEQGTSLIEQ